MLAAEKIFKKLDEWRDSYSFVSKVLNLGGGFGIRYTEDDEPLHATEYVEKIIEAVKENASRYGFDIPEIWIEPVVLSWETQAQLFIRLALKKKCRVSANMWL